MICISAKTSEERSELISFLKLIGCDYKIYDSSRKGIFGNLIDFIVFFIFIRKNKIKKILGAPCSRNRYVSFILGVPFASYMRSVHPDPNALTSISDVLHYKLSRLGIKLKIFNPYEADFIFVSTEINRDFLLIRGVNSEKIFNVGAIWLKGIVLKSQEGRVIYLTQSFSSHRNKKSDEEQKVIIEKLARFFHNSCYQLVLRKHPRDINNYSFIEKYGVFVDSSPAMNFLDSIREKDFIMGSFSTMVMEVMSIGGRFIPVHLNSSPALNDLFKKNGIYPLDFCFLTESFTDLEGKVVKNKEFFSSFDISPIENFVSKLERRDR